MSDNKYIKVYPTQPDQIFATFDNGDGTYGLREMNVSELASMMQDELGDKVYVAGNILVSSGNIQPLTVQGGPQAAYEDNLPPLIHDGTGQYHLEFGTDDLGLFAFEPLLLRNMWDSDDDMMKYILILPAYENGIQKVGFLVFEISGSNLILSDIGSGYFSFTVFIPRQNL